MPFEVVQQECETADGETGSHIVRRKDTGEQVSCHKSREDAEQSAQIRKMEASDVQRE